MAFSIRGVRCALGSLLKANITLTAPQAQACLLFAPQRKSGPHLPE
jgi:hypothetical protein